MASLVGDSKIYIRIKFLDFLSCWVDNSRPLCTPSYSNWDGPAPAGVDGDCAFDNSRPLCTPSYSNWDGPAPAGVDGDCAFLLFLY
jgi:hypothetical protein